MLIRWPLFVITLAPRRVAIGSKGLAQNPQSGGKAPFLTAGVPS
jgi:hypothetical protein